MAMSVKKRSLYVYEWQKLRVSLDFSTLPTTMTSVRACDRFLRKYTTSQANLYKVINLYAATVMGLNGQLKRKQGTLKHNDMPDNNGIRDLKERIALVQATREPLSALYAEAGEDLASFQVDDFVRRQELATASLMSLLDIHKSLRDRWVSSHKRDYEVQRDELCEYLEMLEGELQQRRVKFVSAFGKGVKISG
jgi:hypothetical protein